MNNPLKKLLELNQAFNEKSVELPELIRRAQNATERISNTENASAEEQEAADKEMSEIVLLLSGAFCKISLETMYAIGDTSEARAAVWLSSMQALVAIVTSLGIKKEYFLSLIEETFDQCEMSIMSIKLARGMA